jgi:hypothetical protein
MNPEGTKNEPVSAPPKRVRLPGFVRDEDVGLGDVLIKVTHAFGVRPCAGCARRAATLNRWMTLAGRTP